MGHDLSTKITKMNSKVSYFNYKQNDILDTLLMKVGPFVRTLPIIYTNITRYYSISEEENKTQSLNTLHLIQSE